MRKKNELQERKGESRNELTKTLGKKAAEFVYRVAEKSAGAQSIWLFHEEKIPEGLKKR